MASRSQTNEFYWFFGVVETRPEQDPKNLGRVKVRALYYHSPFKKDIPTDKLPWALVVMPPTSASNSGIGTTPFGLVEGSWVFGFFKDGKYAQEPVILGTFNGIEPELEEQAKGNNPNSDGGDSFCSYDEKNPGDGFRDGRTETERELAPKIAKNHKFPDGKETEGNDQGVDFEDEIQPKYPREDYLKCSDVNHVALGSKEKFKDKLYGLKYKSRKAGGLIDDGFCIAETGMEDFECGIIESVFNKKFEIKPIKSTTYKTKLETYKPFTETPEKLNDSAEVIYDKSTIKNEKIYSTDIDIRNSEKK
jgi:hypothetical protein